MKGQGFHPDQVLHLHHHGEYKGLKEDVERESLKDKTLSAMKNHLKKFGYKEGEIKTHHDMMRGTNRKYTHWTHKSGNGHVYLFGEHDSSPNVSARIAHSKISGGGHNVTRSQDLKASLQHVHESLVLEDGAPANAVGGGHVAGLGVGPQGEPGGKKKTNVVRRIKRFKDFIK